MKACNQYSQLSYPVAPTLFLEFHGSPQEVNEHAELVGMSPSYIPVKKPELLHFSGEICRGCSGSEFNWSKEESERNRLWNARHNSYYASLALRPGSKVRKLVFVGLKAVDNSRFQRFLGIHH